MYNVGETLSVNLNLDDRSVLLCYRRITALKAKLTQTRCYIVYKSFSPKVNKHPFATWPHWRMIRIVELCSENWRTWWTIWIIIKEKFCLENQDFWNLKEKVKRSSDLGLITKTIMKSITTFCLKKWNESKGKNYFFLRVSAVTQTRPIGQVAVARVRIGLDTPPTTF